MLYLKRAVKYFIQLLIVFIGVYLLMYLLGASSIETLFEVFATSRGLAMLAVIIVLSLLYPKIGYIDRNIQLDPVNQRDAVLKTFDLCDYQLVSESDVEMIFRKESQWGKLKMLYEDKIVVTKFENTINVAGNRREVVRLEYRIKSHIL